MKIATLNLNGLGTRYGTWPERLARTAAWLDELRPDLVLLQAVMRVDGHDQAEELARAVAYPYCRVATASPDAMGVAVLARIPLLEVTPVPLRPSEDPEDPHPRLLLGTRVVLGANHLHVVNAHFSWVSHVNANNISEALAHLATLDGPLLLAGDLNARPESEGMQRLVAAGFVDAWAHLQRDDAGHTFPADAPRERIDFLWANRALAPALGGITRFGADAPLSDHLGLMLALDWRASVPGGVTRCSELFA